MAQCVGSPGASAHLVPPLASPASPASTFASTSTFLLRMLALRAGFLKTTGAASSAILTFGTRRAPPRTAPRVFTFLNCTNHFDHLPDMH